MNSKTNLHQQKTQNFLQNKKNIERITYSEFGKPFILGMGYSPELKKKK
jgi:hypothetical protein